MRIMGVTKPRYTGDDDCARVRGGSARERGGWTKGEGRGFWLEDGEDPARERGQGQVDASAFAVGKVAADLLPRAGSGRICF